MGLSQESAASLRGDTGPWQVVSQDCRGPSIIWGHLLTVRLGIFITRLQNQIRLTICIICNRWIYWFAGMTGHFGDG